MYQGSLLATGAPSIDAGFTGAVRHDLGRGAWVEETPDWLTGSDALFDEMCAAAPWETHERVMWGTKVDEPRLSIRTWPDPPPLVRAMARTLAARYGCELPEVSANLYRGGADSVAFHGDTAGRYRAETVVAIVSLGSPRRFLLRPKGGGTSTVFTPTQGDLLVMGGTCQHTWDHAVPTMASAGPRVSLMFRESGVF